MKVVRWLVASAAPAGLAVLLGAAPQREAGSGTITLIHIGDIHGVEFATFESPG